MGLALGFELLPEVLDTAPHLGHECPRLTVLSLSCRILVGGMSCPVSVQEDPHTTFCVFLVGDSIPLYALPDGVNSRAKTLGGLLDANTCPGRMSCGVLSFSHTGDTKLFGPEPQAGRSQPRASMRVLEEKEGWGERDPPPRSVVWC
jgi:hypothetical protein